VNLFLGDIEGSLPPFFLVQAVKHTSVGPDSHEKMNLLFFQVVSFYQLSNIEFR
jgi:hypothetical protein